MGCADGTNPEPTVADSAFDKPTNEGSFVSLTNSTYREGGLVSCRHIPGDGGPTAAIEAENNATCISSTTSAPNWGEDGERPLQKSKPKFGFIAAMFIFTCVLCSAIELRIDRRCTLADLKTRLEEYVQVPSSDFKVSLSNFKGIVLRSMC